MAVRIIDNHWYVDIRHEGRRRRIKSPEDSKKGAQAYELLLRGRLTRGEPLRRLPKPEGKSFREFAQEWFETYVKANNKPSEQTSKDSILRCHLLPAFGDTNLKDISERRIERFKSRKLREGLHPKTVNNMLTVLSKCLGCAVEWKELERAPSIKLLKVPPVEMTCLSDQECHRLLSVADKPVWNLMVLTALHTGMCQGSP